MLQSPGLLNQEVNTCWQIRSTYRIPNNFTKTQGEIWFDQSAVPPYLGSLLVSVKCYLVSRGILYHPDLLTWVVVSHRCCFLLGAYIDAFIDQPYMTEVDMGTHPKNMQIDY
jgi:hypothetical protein